MVRIITGRINSGKSQTIKELYQQSKKGDGFIAEKNIIDNNLVGYDIIQLSNQSKKIYAIKKEASSDKEIACQIGPYVFLKETVHHIENKVKSMIDSGVSPIYLDEIGQLELYDYCFHDIFTYMLEKQVDCIISVREDLLDEVINKYQIKDVQIENV